MPMPVADDASVAHVPPPTERIRVEGLTRRFGGVTALDGVSFSVADGERLAVIGPNGAGKSTLLRLLAGQDKPTSGSILLHGTGRIEGRAAHHFTKAGVALGRQVPRPLRTLTIAENVQMGVRSGRSRSHLAPQAKIAEVLQLTGLEPMAGRLAGSLPLLDLKRLEVARALASSPRVLLLDEVSAGLNDRELDVAITMIRDINQAGVAVVLVEHVQRVVHEIAERVIVLDWGRLLAEGTPAEVTADAEVRRIYLGGGRRAEASFRKPVAGTPNDATLELRDVSVRRGGIAALRQVDLTVGAGEIIAVLGSNGAGKSSLAQTISGILRVDSGRIMWRGEDITGTPSFRRARAGIAHCQEGRKLFAGMTVQENLELGAFDLAVAPRRERLEEVFDIFPILRDRAGQIATSMSGGQQQMVAIGRALMARPRLVVCDEVTLGLSPKVADEIYGSLGAIVASGSSLILVEQDAARCLSVAHRALVLARGSVVYSGLASELTEDDLVTAYLDHRDGS
jgi:ABC-type branched-subunit amino acid transport system ATPase component